MNENILILQNQIVIMEALITLLNNSHLYMKVKEVEEQLTFTEGVIRTLKLNL